MARPRSTRRFLLGAALTLLLVGFGAHQLGCSAAVQPPVRQLVKLKGSPYDRGLQHGQQLSSRIRSFYTTLLTSSLLPYMNREQPDIAAFLPEYQKARYQDGHFSFELLLDSAKEMEKSIPKSYREEMRGISDGCGLPYENILVLNTFVDSVMAVRGVALALRLSASPLVETVEFVGLGADGVDNDGDGKSDEKDEGLLNPYRPLPHASFVEVPPSARIRLVIFDKDGVDPATLRLQLGTQVFLGNDPAIATRVIGDDGARLEAIFTPPAPLEGGATLSLVIEAGDKSLVTKPPPSHPRFMREERITFTVKGAGKKPAEVANTGVNDGRSQPPSIAFALRGAATSDGKPLLAQHFTLLDANTSHKHTAVFVHQPETGPAFTVVGWAGVIWGFSGLNAKGVAYAAQYSDTLDNSIIAALLGSITDLSTAKLTASGTPIGIAARQALEKAGTTGEAVALMKTFKYAYGWNALFADAAGKLRALEIDANVDTKDSGGVLDYGPEADEPGNLDESGKLLASESADDLRISTHYRKNTDDIFRLEVQGQRIVPQASWSSFYYRSLAAFSRMGTAISTRSGPLTVDGVIEILRRPELVDHSDSMNAVVIEPFTRTLHSAMGEVPATSTPFETLELLKEAP